MGDANSGTSGALLTVSLSGPSGKTVSLNHATADGTAVAGSDYIAASGVVTLSPGEVSKNISVAIIGDLDNEPDETFSVGLTNQVNATIADAQGGVTIINNDTPATDSLKKPYRNLPLRAS